MSSELDSESASIIARAVPFGKHFLLAVTVLMSSALAATAAKTYTTWMPPEVFTFGGVVVAILVLLRWAIRPHLQGGETA